MLKLIIGLNWSGISNSRRSWSLQQSMMLSTTMFAILATIARTYYVIIWEAVIGKSFLSQSFIHFVNIWLCRTLKDWDRKDFSITASQMTVVAGQTCRTRLCWLFSLDGSLILFWLVSIMVDYASSTGRPSWVASLHLIMNLVSCSRIGRSCVLAMWLFNSFLDSPVMRGENTPHTNCSAAKLSDQ